MAHDRPISSSPDAASPAGSTPRSGAGDGAGAASLAAGAKVGSRFVVESLQRTDELGAVYAAKDEKTGRTVALRVMDAAVAPNEDVLNVLRAEVKSAAAVQHKNVAATYGMGRAGAFLYIAGEHVDGTTLRVLLERKRESGKPFSVRGAYNVVAHACNAIAALPGAVHGRLNADTIQVQRNGRVKLADVGVAAGTTGFTRAAPTTAVRPYEPPEWNPAAAPTAAADVYGLGILLFELLTARTPKAGESLSALRPDVPGPVDGVLAAALAQDPAARPATPAAFKDAIQGAFGAALSAEEAEGERESGRARAVSGDGAVSGTGATLPAAGAATIPADAAARPRVGARVAADAPVRPGVELAEDSAHSSFAVGDVLPLDENLEKQERWLVSKGSEDWGPFSAEELRNQVRKLRVTEFDMIEDRETGDRFVLNEIPYFKPFLVKWRPERVKQIEQEKIRAAARRARNVRLSIIGGIAAAILASLGMVAYLIYGPKHVKDLNEEYPLAGAAVVRLLAANMSDDPTEGLKSANAKVPKELLKIALSKKKAAGKKRGKWASGYDDSETVVLEVDDSDDEGGIGGEPLKPDDLMGGWSAVFPEVKKCLLASGGGSYIVRFTVLPNGSTKGIRLKGKSGTAGEGCVKRALSGAKFPTNAVATPVDWPVRI